MLTLLLSTAVNKVPICKTLPFCLVHVLILILVQNDDYFYLTKRSFDKQTDKTERRQR